MDLNSNDFRQLKRLKLKMEKRKNNKNILSKDDLDKVSEFVFSYKKQRVNLTRKGNEFYLNDKLINTNELIDINDKVSILELIKLLDKGKKIDFTFVNYSYANTEVLFNLQLVRKEGIMFTKPDLNRIGILLNDDDLKLIKTIESGSKKVRMYEGEPKTISITEYRFIRKMIAKKLNKKVSDVSIDYR